MALELLCDWTWSSSTFLGNGVHLLTAKLSGDLDGAFPVADSGLAHVLVRAGPPVEREHRGDLDAGCVQRTLELGDLGVVCAGVDEERQEVVPR